jgi:hypothetical protein
MTKERIPQLSPKMKMMSIKKCQRIGFGYRTVTTYYGQKVGAVMILSDLLGALARGYCSEKNSSKTVDPDLIEAMAEEVQKRYYGRERQ